VVWRWWSGGVEVEVACWTTGCVVPCWEVVCVLVGVCRCVLEPPAVVCQLYVMYRCMASKPPLFQSSAPLGRWHMSQVVYETGDMGLAKGWRQVVGPLLLPNPLRCST
jgi:hypothetical protein